MKTIIVIVSMMLLFSALSGLVVRYEVPDDPEPIAVQPLTEHQIKIEVQHERAERAAKQRLETAVRVSRAVYLRNGCTDQFAELTARMSIQYGLNPRLLAAVVISESSANPSAISGHDVGLMQINTKTWKYSRAKLLNPEQNMAIGARILKSCIHRYGVQEGLHAYNGFGNPTNEYSQAVLLRAGLQI